MTEVEWPGMAEKAECLDRWIKEAAEPLEDKIRRIVREELVRLGKMPAADGTMRRPSDFPAVI